MKNERLTDERLETLWKLTVVSWPDDPSKHHAEDVLARSAPAMLAELRERRAADLSQVERMAIAWAIEQARLVDPARYAIAFLAHDKLLAIARSS